MRHVIRVLLLISFTFPVFGTENSTSATLKEYAGPAIAVVSGNVGWGIAVGAHIRTNIVLPLTIGLETGFRRYVDEDNKMLGVPLLVTAAYQLDTLFDSQKIHPYVGGAVGANYVMATDAVNRLYLQWLVYPGVGFDLNELLTLKVETRIGLSNTAFVFMPLAALEFKL